MQVFSANPIKMLTNLYHNRELIRASVKRDILGRYRGSILGLLWSFFTPLFMLGVYTFVFSSVFNARWGTESDSKAEFALILFAGLLVFNLFSECINRAPGLILQNVNYVKKVVYPLEILPFVSLLSAFFHTIISLGVWLLAYVFVYGIPHATVLYFPLIILPFLFFLMGLSWALAALGVYLRDISQITGVITTALMFLSPIFYPVTALPEKFQHLILFNPLVTIIEQIRGVLYFATPPEFGRLAIYWGVTLFIAWLGFFIFQKTRKGFSDVL